jgi:hypothetical protein
MTPIRETVRARRRPRHRTFRDERHDSLVGRRLLADRLRDKF